MPRSSSHPHVLRTVRERLGLTQEKLAKEVGVKKITIQKIELGKNKPGRELAFRIMAETGLDPMQLMENTEPQSPYLVRGHPEQVTRESYEARRNLKLGDKRVQEEISRDVELFSKIIRQMLETSVARGKFDTFRYALEWALGKLRTDFDLPVKTYSTRDVFKGKSAKREPLQTVSPGCGNGEKRSVNQRRVPSARQSRRRA
jgi:DNA-binding XRE family transcriptional regulator